MNQYWILLLALSVVSGLNPTLRAVLRHQALINFKNAIVPLVNRQIQHIALPDVHEKHSGFDIEVTNGHIDFAALDPNHVNIEYMSGTNFLRYTTTGIIFAGRAHVHAKSRVISAKADITADARNFGVSVQVGIVSNGARPNIYVANLQIGLAHSHITIHVHGGFIAHIIDFVVNLLKGHIIKEVVKGMQAMVPPAVTNSVNAYLNTMPVDIVIGPTISLKYLCPHTPQVRGDFLFASMVSYIHPSNNDSPPPYEPGDIPEIDGGVPQGVQILFSDVIVRSSIDSLYSTGRLTMNFERDLLGHHILIECSATQSPTFAFNNAVQGSLASNCRVIADGDAAHYFFVISELQVGFGVYTNVNGIFFNIQEVKFSKLEYKQENPNDIEWFKNGVNQVLQVAVEIANAELGQRGIPLPIIQGVTYSDIGQIVRGGYLAVGVNPSFHFGTEPETQ